MSIRLTLALETGAFRLPQDGKVAVFDPRDQADLSALPMDRTVVIEPFFPDHRRWAAARYRTLADVPDGAAFAAAVVFLPRAKAMARDRIATAARLTTGPVIVDGAKTQGIDAVHRDMKARTNPSDPIAKAHGKLFQFDPASVDLSDWIAPQGRVEGFATRAGVFSADAVDEASRLLAAALPRALGPRVADLGAGWGYLSAAVLSRAEVAELHLVEADAVALDCARINLSDPRASFHWADATDWTPDRPLDTIVMNPPFHQGRAADSDLGRRFITAAARGLSPQGRLFMVANRHLPYEAALTAAFRDVSEIGGDTRYKLFQASRPTRRRG